VAGSGGCRKASELAIKQVSILAKFVKSYKNLQKMPTRADIYIFCFLISILLQSYRAMLK